MDQQAANIGHFDHSFACALEHHTVSAVPAKEKQATLKPDMIAKLDEEIGTNLGDMKRRTILEIRYETLEKLSWDHSVSSVKVSCAFLHC